jgi:hypothetical protein
MIFKPITLEEVAEFLHIRKEKPKPEVPTIHFDLPPPLTPEQIAKSISGNGGPWRSLQDVYRESIEDRWAKRLSDLYDMTVIPEPEWDPEDNL